MVTSVGCSGYLVGKVPSYSEAASPCSMKDFILQSSHKSYTLLYTVVFDLMFNYSYNFSNMLPPHV